MDRMKLVWFVVGLILGLGGLLGASFKGQEPGKAQEAGRFQVMQVRDPRAPSGSDFYYILLVDTKTGRVSHWSQGTAKENGQETGWIYDYWTPIRTTEEEFKEQDEFKKRQKK